MSAGLAWTLAFLAVTGGAAALAAPHPPAPAAGPSPVAAAPASPAASTPSPSPLAASPASSPSSPPPLPSPSPPPAAEPPPIAPVPQVPACTSSMLRLSVATGSTSYRRGDAVLIESSAFNHTAAPCSLTLDTCSAERASVYDARGNLVWTSPATGCPALVVRDLAPGTAATVTFSWVAAQHGTYLAAVTWRLFDRAATAPATAFRVI